MTRKKIHALFHVPFEGLGCIEAWIALNGHILTTSEFYGSYKLPDIEHIDWLVVMGGPMGVSDESVYPWLREEKEFIRQAIEKNKTVTGICLGSQLIAEVLGARVYPNKQKEIGWFNISGTEKALKHPLFSLFESEFPVFHWHGDTFDLPDGSELLYSSSATANQAFIFRNKVLGLQFHLEATAGSLRAMTENGADELIQSETVQAEKQILATNQVEETNRKMYRILDYFSGL
ncbi:MAG TPA: type 1 glutamine amidotransferase [Paludibacter sp.]|nr:type 1 glutamine amidotransferase [Paludibacter sp.]